MKQFSILTLLLLIHVVTYSQWEQLSIPTSKNIYSSSFINDSVGWIGIENNSNNAKFYHTTDAGDSWQQGSINDAAGGITYLKFVSVNVGFAVVNGAAFKTSDGGDSWTQLTMPGIPYADPFFFNADTGFIGGDGVIYKTLDGGTTWMTFTTEANVLYHLTFFDANNGTGCEYNGYIYYTYDGGETWDWIDGGLWTTYFSSCYSPWGEINSTSLTDVFGQTTVGFASFYADDLGTLYDGKFFDSERAYAVGTDGMVVSTIDGQTNWVVENLTASTLNVVDGFKYVYVFGNAGSAFRITKTCFISVDFESSIDQLSVSFTDETDNSTEWFWDFGDGTTSTEQNPVHSYAIDGGYTVCHMAGNDSCGTHQLCKTIVLCSSGSSLNYAGSLDTSLSQDGFILYDSNNDYYDEFASVAIQEDHKVLGATRYTHASMVRYEINGNPDSTFGISGEVFFDEAFECRQLSLSPTGQIAVAGTDNYDIVLYRFHEDGSIDSSFGDSGNATVGVSPQPNIGNQYKAMTFQPDGKILVFGGWSYFGYHSFVFRLNADGLLDNTFGDNGISILSLTEVNPYTRGAIALQGDGKILITSTYQNGTYSIFAVARLLDDGSTDESFGTDGLVTTTIVPNVNSAPYDLDIQSDGKIVVVGVADNKMALVRYNTDGMLDENFGAEGIVTLELGIGANGTAVAVQNNGKILVGGLVPYDGGPTKIFIARYDTSGSLDNSFGTEGISTTNYSCQSTYAWNMTTDEDKIYLSGGISYALGGQSAFIARFNNVVCTPSAAAYNSVNNGLSVQFEDQSAGSISWQWDFGDGENSSEQNPTHNYGEEGTYSVCLSVSDSCGNNQICKSVSVCEPLNTDYLFNQNNLEVHFSNLVNTADSAYWDFGDGTTSVEESPTHDYSSAGTYYACLYEFDVCGDIDTMCKEITVCGQLESNFNFTANGPSVQFNDLSENSNGRTWDFGDGITDTLKNPTHIYDLPGEYNACIYSFNDCETDSMCQQISIISTGTGLPFFLDSFFSVYPNPFSKSAIIKFSLNEPSHFSIKLFSAAGKEVMTVTDENFTEGDHEVNLNRESLASGIYLLKCKTSDLSFIKKIVAE